MTSRTAPYAGKCSILGKTACVAFVARVKTVKFYNLMHPEVRSGVDDVLWKQAATECVWRQLREHETAGRQTTAQNANNKPTHHATTNYDSQIAKKTAANKKRSRSRGIRRPTISWTTFHTSLSIDRGTRKTSIATTISKRINNNNKCPVDVRKHVLGGEN